MVNNTGSRLRIGVDARPLTQPRDGIHVYTRSLLEKLTHNPHTWFLYGTPPKSGMGRETEFRNFNANNKFSRALTANFSITQQLRADAIDVFWSPRHHLPLLTIPVASIVTVHDLGWHSHPHCMPLTRRLQERALFGRSINQASHILCVSQATQSALISNYPKTAGKTTVTHLGPGCLPHSHPQDTGLNRYGLFVGTVEPRKNVRRLLAAFAIAQNHYAGDLVLAGAEGWIHWDLEHEIRRLQITDRVRIVASPSTAQLEELYQDAEFVILPSLLEGFGLTLVEAMYAGKPLITSNVSSMPEIAGDAALYIDPLSTTSISETIVRLTSDRALYETLVDNANRRAAQFSWENTAQQTMRIIERVGSSTIPG